MDFNSTAARCMAGSSASAAWIAAFNSRPAAASAGSAGFQSLSAAQLAPPSLIASRLTSSRLRFLRLMQAFVIARNNSLLPSAIKSYSLCRSRRQSASWTTSSASPGRATSVRA